MISSHTATGEHVPQNPFLEDTENAWQELNQQGWSSAALEQLSPALHMELILCATQNNGFRPSPQLLHLEAFATWISHHWQAAESLAQRAQLFSLLRLYKIVQSQDLKELYEHGTHTLFATGLEKSASLKRYFAQVFGFQEKEISFLLEQLNENNLKTPASHLVPLGARKYNFKNVIHEHFGTLAETALERTKIFFAPQFQRAFSVITPQGQKNLFLQSEDTLHPLDAAKWVHEVAHLVDYEAQIAQGKLWADHSILARENFAIEAEFRCVQRFSEQMPKVGLQQNWLAENLFRQLDLLGFELSLFDFEPPVEPKTKFEIHDVFSVPLLSAVYVVAALNAHTQS